MRVLVACAALAAVIALAGCNEDRAPAVNGRYMQPLSDKMLLEIDNKDMTAQSPIMLRIFKEESELEIWKEDKSGRFSLLRTYPICRWSGELGPKIKAGDRQAPEGFYSITPGLMNPNSNYYLAINTGFPNAYDRANDRTGSFVMIHGDCASAGCYAMTDEQIGEIYALAREAFFGGQKSFQIQAYPFRMTPFNLARHRNSPHMAFWRMLKEGYDHFEVTRLPPKVDVCDKRYVFDAEISGEVSAADRCPASRVPEDVAAAVRDKQRRDDMQTAQLINRGTPAAPISNGGQGGMNRKFLTAVVESGPGVTIRTSSGTIPAHVHPPAALAPAENTAAVADIESAPPPQLRSPQIASAVPTNSDAIGTFLTGQSGARDQAAASRSSAAAQAALPRSKSAVEPVTVRALRPVSELQGAETKTTNSVGRKRNPASLKQEESKGPQTGPAGSTNLLNGAAPSLPSGGFDSHFAASQ